MDLGRFELLSFDCYGTLIDWETGILTALRPWAARTGQELSDPELLAGHARFEPEVQAEQPELPYPQVLEEVLRRFSAECGAPADEEEIQAFGESIGAWPPFPDSGEALSRLQMHFKLVVLSNVDRVAFARSEESLGVRFDGICTADEIGSYKPDPRNFAYLFHRAEQLGSGRDRILHVAQSLFHDHVPAKRLGMPTVWVQRRAGKEGWGATLPPEVQVEPDLVVPDLAALADLVERAAGPVS